MNFRAIEFIKSILRNLHNCYFINIDICIILMHEKSIYRYKKTTIEIFICVIVSLCATKNQIV